MLLPIRNQPYFEGWYVKHQKGQEVLTVILGAQINLLGESSAFIQVLTKDDSYYVNYDICDYRVNRKKKMVRIGNTILTRRGICLDIDTADLKLKGKIVYGPMSKIHYDLMGPFRYIPRLHCYHEIVSMKHAIDGVISLNGKRIDVKDGIGYIEGDRGSSFPQNYMWVQCNRFEEEQLEVFATIADIKVLKKSMRGTIAIVKYYGKEFRFATYLGAKGYLIHKDTMLIRQGKYRLRVKVNQLGRQELVAPVKGEMKDVIKESPMCFVRVQFFIGELEVFHETSKYASCEFVEKKRN